MVATNLGAGHDGHGEDQIDPPADHPGRDENPGDLREGPSYRTDIGSVFRDIGSVAEAQISRQIGAVSPEIEAITAQIDAIAEYVPPVAADIKSVSPYVAPIGTNVPPGDPPWKKCGAWKPL